MRKFVVLVALVVVSSAGSVLGQVTLDSLEPDPDCLTVSGVPAYEIGSSNALPCNPGTASQWSTARSIFPAGDLDHQWFRFNGSAVGHLVRMGTAAAYDTAPAFPTCAPVPPATSNPDTFLELRYENERDYFGSCVDGVLCQIIGSVCADSSICTELFNLNPKFGTDGLGGHDNPLACNDDRTPGSDLGSQMEICLPQNTLLGTNGDDYCLRTKAAPKAVSPLDEFNYEVQVRNLSLCPIEVEPNDSFAQANPISLGDTVHGIYDFAGRWPFQDADLFTFDVVATTTVTIQTLGHDIFKVDTGLELFVGPDDSGDFFFTGISDDDGGPGFLSQMAVVLPPASDLLGNTTANANYFISVTSFRLCPNFPYTLKIN